MRAFGSARFLISLAFVTTLGGLLAATAPTTAAAQAAGSMMTTASGLQIADTKVGTAQCLCPTRGRGPADVSQPVGAA